MTIAQHISQAVKTQKLVLLKGTAAAVYPKGFGLCYDRDYGTAADVEGRRDKVVQSPASGNNSWFAGVLDHDVTLPSTGEKLVTINLPGSVCEIAIGGQDAVVGATRFTCSCSGTDAGRFTLEGFAGKGSALALQTASIKAVIMAGEGAYTHADKTLTEVGAFTDVVAGDRCILLGFDGGTVGEYAVASRTDDTLVFAADIGGAADRGVVTGYVIGETNETTVLAKLADGAESGLQEVVPIVDNAAFDLMVGGYSFLAAGTLGAGDATETIADGTYNGQKKAIQCLGANGTNDADITISHHSVSSPEHLFFKAAGQVEVMEWYGAIWGQITSNAPTTT